MLVNPLSSVNRQYSTSPSQNSSIYRLRAAAGRGVQVLGLLDLGHQTQASVSLVPDGVDALQEDVAQNVESIIATRLYTAVPVSFGSHGERKVLLLDRKLLVSDRNAEVGELISRDGGREEIALLLLIVFASEKTSGNPETLVCDMIVEHSPARDLLVQCFNDLIRHKGKGGTSVGDGLVARLCDLLTRNRGRCGVEHPEALGVIDVGVVNRVGTDQVSVDVTEGVERFGSRVARRVEGRGEQLSIRRDVTLGYHVGNRGVLRVRFAVLGDGVDRREGEAEQAVTSARDELVSGFLGQFDGLVGDLDATDVDRVGADIARGRTAVAVGDLPTLSVSGLPSGRLGGVKDIMTLLVLGGQLGREDLVRLVKGSHLSHQGVQEAVFSEEWQKFSAKAVILMVQVILEESDWP